MTQKATEAAVLFWFVLLAIFSGTIQLDLPKNCGKRHQKTVNLIVEGRPATIGNWPWHTAIFHRVGTGTPEYKCGGSILDKNTILTAGHCVRLTTGIIDPEKLIVQVGRQRLMVADDRAQEHEASRILVHKRFRIGNLQHDVALIVLATNIEFTDFVQPVCLWDQGDDRLLIRDRQGTIVGFGATGTAASSETLNEADLPVVDNQVCIDSNRGTFGLALTADMYCAGRRDGKNACNGDSGGGMFFEIGGRWYVRGIVSFSPSQASNNNRCDPYEYVVFMDVARYVNWIAQQLNGTFVEAPAQSDVHPKLHLLSQDICGANNFPSTEESDKPVLLTYPWIGLIEYSQEGVREKQTLCHAMLISEQYLVTAAECVYNTGKLRPTSIRLGDYDTSNSQDCGQIGGSSVCAPPTQTLSIETITVHQQYNKPRFANAIALIRVYSKADISRDNIKHICLPLSKELRSFKPPTFIRSGWKNSKSQPQMQRTEVKVVESVTCQRKYSEQRIPLEKTFRQICIERDPTSGGAANCVFDVAAAPLQAVQTVNGSPRYVLHGLLTFGPKKCHLDYPNVYTNVGTYLGWILDHIQP
ncbi:prostasin-like [Ochlerotatus camptorhynchus]|uniref:prostasin-like n=1 Tax=Ochlerotatus camptorhynchus TaxID=644619 RepID=UPI0031DF6B8E